MQDNNNSAEKTLLEIEREELNLLIKCGVRFEVTYKVSQRKPGLLGWFKKRETVEKTEAFEIHEPTLSTLDRLSAVWLEMGLDEETLSAGGTSTLVEAKQIASHNANRMAEVIAIAVLGEDYYINEIDSKGRVKERTDDSELKRLAGIFLHTIKPSKLVGLSEVITNASNLGDFIGSMRLLSGARTTLPRKESIE